MIIPNTSFINGGEYSLMFKYGNNQAVTRTVKANLLPQNACSMQYSNLVEHTTTPHHFENKEDSLLFKFSFEPAVY